GLKNVPLFEMWYLSLFLLYGSLTQSHPGQDSITYAHDVRVVVDYHSNNRLKGAKVQFIAGKRSYTAKYVKLNQNSRFDSLPAIKGTFKVSHPGYEPQTREVIPYTKG